MGPPSPPVGALSLPGTEKSINVPDQESVPPVTGSSSSHVSNGVVDVKIPDEILDDEEPLWKCFVVGYFMADAPHVGKIHATVNRIWASPGKPSKIDVQFINPTTVLFRIEDPQIRLRVLKRRYWHFSDVPLVACEWSPETAHVKPDLSAMPLWVDLKNVPGYLFTEKGIRFLAGITGKFVKMHPNTERCTRLDLARVLVEVDLQKPLMEGICFKNKDGVVVTVVVSYPWLPPRCSACADWGHNVKACSLGNVTILGKQSTSSILQKEVGNQIVEKAGSVGTGMVQDLIAELQNTTPLHMSPAKEVEGTEVEVSGSNVSEAEVENVTDGGGEKQKGNRKEEEWLVVTRTSRHSSPNRAELKGNVANAATGSVSPNGFRVLEGLEEGEIGNPVEVAEGKPVLHLTVLGEIQGSTTGTTGKGKAKNQRNPHMNKKALLQAAALKSNTKASIRK